MTLFAAPLSLRRSALRLFLAVAGLFVVVPAYAVITTTATLAVTSAGQPVTSVAPGVVVTLTATVAAAGAPVTLGQVKFCDAAAAFCTDSHVFGTAQIRPDGTASFKFTPVTGAYSFKAVATVAGGSASSSSVSLTVTPASLTPAQVYLASNASGTITATVTAFNATAIPSGTVTFTSQPSATPLGTVALSGGVLGYGTTSYGSSDAYAYSTLSSTTNVPVLFKSADFNNDGAFDLLETFTASSLNPNTPPASVVVLSGGATNTIALPSGCGSAVTADFNSDGNTDIAAFITGASAPSLLLGNGDGTFSSPVFPTGSTCSPILTGDFNQDGLPDLLVPSASTNNLWLGNGDGTFTPGTPVSLPGNTVLTGDFNGDGALDLATINSSGDLAILFNQGDGTFATTTTSIVFSGGTSPVVADFNNDGKIDLATSAGYNLTVFLSNGDGTFTSQTSTVTTASGYYLGSPLLAGDFNHDGRVDLAGAEGFYGGTTGYSTGGVVALGNGDGTFSTAVNLALLGNSNQYSGYALNYTPVTSLVTDLNGSFIVGYEINGFSRIDNSTLLAGATTSFTSGGTATATASVTPISLPASDGSGSTVNIQAAYSGDSIFQKSSANQNLANLQISTLNLSANNTTVYAGQPVTFTATLTPYMGQGLSTNGETVSILGLTGVTGTLNNGVATITTSSLPVGSHNYSAFFSGDSHFAAAYSSPVTVNVQPNFLTFTVPNHTYGDAPFAVTATSPSNGTISYSVLSGPATISGNTVTIHGAGVITLQAAITAAGQYPAATQTATVTISPAPLTVSADNISRFVGEPLPTFTGKITGAVYNDDFTESFTTTATGTSPAGSYAIVPSASGPALANYTVTVTNGTLTISGSSFLSFTVPNHTYGDTAFALAATSPSNGTITYSVVSGPVSLSGSQVMITGAGTAVILASQAASGGYQATTQTATFSVGKAPLSITASNANRVFGAANPAFTGTVTGAVYSDTFTESFSTSANAASPVGSYPITPAVTGAALGNYTVTPTNGTLTIAQAGTATTFTLSNNNTTLTANVTSLTSGLPTGTVTFLAGQNTLGTAPLVNNTATLSGVTIPSGNVTLTAQYSGDADFTQSAAPPIFLLAVTPANSSLAVSTAGTVTDSLTLAAIPGYTGSVQLSCSGLPVNTSCSFNPQSITFGSSSSANVTVTITTGTSATASLRGSSNVTLAAILGAPALFSLLYLRRRRVPMRSLILPVLLLLTSATLISGCGSNPAPTGSGSTTSSSSTTTTTPAATYTVNVVASGSNGLTQTVPLTLIVH